MIDASSLAACNASASCARAAPIPNVRATSKMAMRIKRPSFACWSALQAYGLRARMKPCELPVLGPDPAHRAAARAHHHRLGLDRAVAESYPLEQRAGGDAGCGEQAVASHHVLDPVFLARVLDAHPGGALALFVGVEHEAPLHLAADAGERCRGEHALGRAADAEIYVNAGRLRVGGMNDAGDIAVRDEPHGSASAAGRCDKIGMARPVEDERGDVF